MGRKPTLPNGEKNESSRVWVFTFYVETDYARLKSVPHVGLACARETATASKMEHYQGVIKFENYKQSSWWFNQFKAYATDPNEIGDDGTPKRYWNWWKPSHSEALARLYVVDAVRWMKVAEGQPNWHRKDQGVVLDDYGLFSYTADSSGLDTESRVIDMLFDGASDWQVAREFPRYYFRRRRQITDLHQDVLRWKEMAVDFHPGVSVSIKEPLKKRKKMSKKDSDGESVCSGGSPDC